MLWGLLGRVPQSDKAMAVIAKHAQRGHVEHQTRRDAEVGADPRGAHCAQRVPVGEGEHATA